MARKPPPSAALEPLATAAQAAAALGLSPWTLRDLVRGGRLSAVHLSERVTRFRWADVRALQVERSAWRKALAAADGYGIPPSDAAPMLSVGPARVRALIRGGRLPAKDFGPGIGYRVKPDHVRRLAAGG